MQNKNFKGFVDETIRDGLQCLTCLNVEYETKIKAIQHMCKIPSITDVIVGMIGVSKKNDQEIKNIVIECEKKHIKLWVLCRLNIYEVEKIRKLQNFNKNVGINLFIATSDIRISAESWTSDDILNKIKCFLEMITKYNLSIRFAIEDAMRTNIQYLSQVLDILLAYDIERITICDTVGSADKEEVREVFRMIKCKRKQYRNSKTLFEWHGHNDRGLGITNSIEAIENGVNYVHGTMIGLGERAGNAALDIMIANVIYNGKITDELTEYYLFCRNNFNNTEEDRYPFWGNLCKKTSTGTHCAAIIKAYYSEKFNLMPKIFPINEKVDIIQNFVVSPLSGRNLIKFIFDYNNIVYDDMLIDNILNYIKETNSVMSCEELIDMYKGVSD